jgi:hypothetical protein
MKPFVALLLLVSGAGAAGPVPAVKPVSFSSIYAENRRLGRPNYITEDYLFTAWGRLFENALGEAEQGIMAPEFSALVSELLAAQEGDTPAAKANRDFLGVVLALARNQTTGGGPSMPEAVSVEIRAVREANGIAESPLFRQKIDYSQFKPRGRYTQSEALAAYFRALRYASAPLFAVRPSAATGIGDDQANLLTAQAQALTASIAANPALKAKYEAWDHRLAWLFGPADDLTVRDYYPLVGLQPAQARARLIALKKTPKILGIVDIGKLESGVTPEEALTGFRLVPQRFTPDSAAFQKLVWPNGGVFTGTGDPLTSGTINGKKVRAFPRFLDLMAANGSPAAAKELVASGDASYENFNAAMTLAKRQMAVPAGLSSELWAAIRAERGPRQAAAVQGLWIWQRHASVLYVKQSTTAVEKGFRADPDRRSAWIEPAPRVYARLAAISAHAGSQLRNKPLADFAATLTRCVSIAKLEAGGSMPKAADAAFLNNLDLTFEESGFRSDEPIVTDVHTEPNSGMVLEEGIEGALPAEKKLNGETAVGGAFRVREFKHPMSDRLTDERWKEMVNQ